MVYVIEPVNTPYDAEEPMPTRLGFVIKAGGAGPTEQFKQELKPVPREVIPRKLFVDGYNPMPDFFSIGGYDFFVSSRFRAVLDKFAPGAVEYIEIELQAPPRMKRAEAYYYINVLGRAHLMNWDRVKHHGPIGPRHTVFAGHGRDDWIMLPPPPGHPAIWHETILEKDGRRYVSAMPKDVLVTNELGEALDKAFPGQVRLRPVREG